MFSTLGLAGGRTRTRDGITPSKLFDTRLLLLWTVVLSHSRPAGR